MPTVQLAKLHQEAAQLSTLFNKPKEYRNGLENLLESYSVPIHRQGRVGGMRPVLFSYEVPPPVLRQLHLEMALQASQRPIEALLIADELWAQRTIETRQLAARLLGATPAENPPQLTTRLESWAIENREEVLAAELRQHGTLSLCNQFPNESVAISAKWVKNKETRLQVLGLGTLQTLLSSDGYTNLPQLFGELTEIAKDPSKKLRPYISDLLSQLAVRSPKETVYFLQQRLAESPQEGTRWLARQVLNSLPDTERESLDQALRALPA